MAKIVFFSVVHVHDDTRVVHKEARSLAEAGHDVVHLCPHTEATLEDFPDGRTDINGVAIEMYGDRAKSRSRIGRFLNGWRAIWSMSVDVVHANEPESWILACVMKVLKGGRPRVVFDVHEHYPSRFDEPHVGRVERWIGKPILALCFHWLPHVTDHIVLAKRSVAPDFDRFSDKCSYVFNFAPAFALAAGEGSPDPYADVREHSDLLVVHVGAFSKWRGWPQMLDAMASVPEKRIFLAALGRVAEGEEVMRARISELGLENRVRILRSVPYEEMFAYLRHADVGIMLYQPGILNHTYAFPMKLYDYMAASIPVIGPDFALEVTPVVDEVDCGRSIDTADSDALAGALVWYADNPEEAKEMGRRGRRAVETTYVWEREAERLVRVYEELTA